MKTPKHQQGVALIIVLWMIMIMMILSGSLMYATRTESGMVDYARRTAVARAIADAATHYAALQLLLPQTERDLTITGTPLQWNYQQHNIEIRAISENGLIDLNMANVELIKAVLKQQLNTESADTLMDALDDFRDVDDLKRVNGAEDKDYHQAGHTAGAKDAPFDRIEELQQVMGMTPILYQTMAHYFTVYSGTTGINPMVAPRHILLLLAEGDTLKVDNYLKQREANSNEYIQPTFGTQFWEQTQDFAYRLQIKVNMDDGAPAYFEERAIKLTPEANPPFITYQRQMQDTQLQF